MRKLIAVPVCKLSVYLQPFCRSSFLECALQSKIARIDKKPIISEVHGLSKSSMLIRLKSSSLVLVVIGSMPMPICNHFHERLANKGKMMTFIGVPLFDALVHRFFEPKKLRLGLSKSTFNAENFICSLSWSVYSDFGAIRSWNVSQHEITEKNP